MQHDPEQGPQQIELAFRELCAQYATWTAACERFIQPGADQVMLREYNAVRQRLEGELLRYMSQHRARESPLGNGQTGAGQCAMCKSVAVVEE